LKVLIATPLIDGRADREFIQGLIQSQGLYQGWACLEGQSHISAARDQLAAQFLATDCDTLVFIDGDIAFTRSDLERLLGAQGTLVSGLYMRKQKQPQWAFMAEEGLSPDIPADASGLLPARAVPAGFLRIQRSVFEDLIRSGLCVSFRSSASVLHHFFQSGVVNGSFLSEDYMFCHLARQVGHPALIEPRIRLGHVGRKTYSEKT
jgi:hypothetical protein